MGRRIGFSSDGSDCLVGVNITSNCVHPGGMVRTATGFTRGPKYCWMHYLEPLFMTLFVNPAAAFAAAAAALCTSRQGHVE